MATRKNKKKTARKQPKRKRLGLYTIMGRFQEAESVICTAYLALREVDDAAAICTTVGQGLRMMREAYNELDYAVGKMTKDFTEESYDDSHNN